MDFAINAIKILVTDDDKDLSHARCCESSYCFVHNHPQRRILYGPTELMRNLRIMDLKRLA